MRKVLIGLLVAALVLAVPIAVLAARGGGGGALNRQAFRWQLGKVTTTKKAFRGVLRPIAICANRAVSGTVSVQLSGAPALFQVKVDGAKVLRPGSVPFNPLKRTTSFTFDFVGNLSPVNGSERHTFRLQWKSSTGRTVVLNKELLNLQYQAGTPGAC
jgi:hypothetical protein